MKIGPYTISRGDIVPFTREVRTPQTTRVASDGSVTVVEKAYTRVEFFRVKIRVDKPEADLVESFLTHGVSFARVAWTFQDGYGTDHVVRYWDKRVRKKSLAANLVEMDLLLRKEVAGP